MSTAPCPRCGNLNKASDKSCPQCYSLPVPSVDNPTPKNRHLWRYFVGLVIVLGIGVVIWQNINTGGNSRLNPDAGVTTVGVVATNNQTFTYPRFTITLNPKASNGGYSVGYGDLAPGQTATIPFSRFTDSDGKRFSIAGIKITQVRARAWPDGNQSTHTFNFKEH